MEPLKRGSYDMSAVVLCSLCQKLLPSWIRYQSQCTEYDHSDTLVTVITTTLKKIYQKYLTFTLKKNSVMINFLD